MPTFAERSTQAEIMDNLSVAGKELDQALNELDVINHLLGGNAVTFSALDKLVRQMQHQEAIITIADLGCGGGGMLRLVAKWANKKNLKFSLFGIDANENVIGFAKRNSREFANIKYLSQDIQSPEFTNHSYDLILATLFLHHFTRDELIQIFKKLASMATYGIIINDLHRHWFAYHSFKFISGIFSRSPMVKSDGPLSVLRGFKRKELIAILQKAGITNYKLRWRWAFRWQLIIWT